MEEGKGKEEEDEFVPKPTNKVSAALGDGLIANKNFSKGTLLLSESKYIYTRKPDMGYNPPIWTFPEVVFQPERDVLMGWLKTSTILEECNAKLVLSADKRSVQLYLTKDVNLNDRIVVYKGETGPIANPLRKKNGELFDGTTVRELLGQIRFVLSTYPIAEWGTLEAELRLLFGTDTEYSPTALKLRVNIIIKKKYEISRDFRDFSLLAKLSEVDKFPTTNGAPVTLQSIRDLLIAPFEVKSLDFSQRIQYLQNISSSTLSIRDSTIEGAGKGLFAEKDFKPYEFITEYGGLRSNSDASKAYPDGDSRQSAYVVQVGNSEWYIDAVKWFKLSQFGRWPNSTLEDGKQNADLAFKNGQVIIEATKEIKKDDEIFVYYGEAYGFPTKEREEPPRPSFKEWLETNVRPLLLKGAKSLDGLAATMTLVQSSIEQTFLQLHVTPFIEDMSWFFFSSPLQESIMEIKPTSLYMDNQFITEYIFSMARNFRMELLEDVKEGVVDAELGNTRLINLVNYVNRKNLEIRRDILTVNRGYKKGEIITEYGGIIYDRDVGIVSSPIKLPIDDWILDPSRGFTLNALGRWADKVDSEEKANSKLVFNPASYKLLLISTENILVGVKVALWEYGPITRIPGIVIDRKDYLHKSPGKKKDLTDEEIEKGYVKVIDADFKTSEKFDTLLSQEFKYSGVIGKLRESYNTMSIGGITLLQKANKDIYMTIFEAVYKTAKGSILKKLLENPKTKLFLKGLMHAILCDSVKDLKLDTSTKFTLFAENLIGKPETNAIGELIAGRSPTLEEQSWIDGQINLVKYYKSIGFQTKRDEDFEAKAKLIEGVPMETTVGVFLSHCKGFRILIPPDGNENVNSCATCQKATDLFCGACLEVVYCSKDCMRKAGHKFTCKKWKKKQ